MNPVNANVSYKMQASDNEKKAELELSNDNQTLKTNVEYNGKTYKVEYHLITEEKKSLETKGDTNEKIKVISEIFKKIIVNTAALVMTHNQLQTSIQHTLSTFKLSTEVGTDNVYFQEEGKNKMTLAELSIKTLNELGGSGGTKPFAATDHQYDNFKRLAQEANNVAHSTLNPPASVPKPVPSSVPAPSTSSSSSPSSLPAGGVAISSASPATDAFLHSSSASSSSSTSSVLPSPESFPTASPIFKPGTGDSFKEGLLSLSTESIPPAISTGPSPAPATAINDKTAEKFGTILSAIVTNPDSTSRPPVDKEIVRKIFEDKKAGDEKPITFDDVLKQIPLLYQLSSNTKADSPADVAPIFTDVTDEALTTTDSKAATQPKMNPNEKLRTEIREFYNLLKNAANGTNNVKLDQIKKNLDVLLSKTANLKMQGDNDQLRKIQEKINKFDENSFQASVLGAQLRNMKFNDLKEKIINSFIKLDNHSVNKFENYIQLIDNIANLRSNTFSSRFEKPAAIKNALVKALIKGIIKGNIEINSEDLKQLLQYIKSKDEYKGIIKGQMIEHWFEPSDNAVKSDVVLQHIQIAKDNTRPDSFKRTLKNTAKKIKEEAPKLFKKVGAFFTALKDSISAKLKPSNIDSSTTASLSSSAPAPTTAPALTTENNSTVNKIRSFFKGFASLFKKNEANVSNEDAAKTNASRTDGPVSNNNTGNQSQKEEEEV